MDTGKVQGSRAGEVGSLSAPMQMLRMEKFREAELMAEQYLRTHPEEGMAYLVLFSAKVKAQNLCNFTKGGAIPDEALGCFGLYVENRSILEDFFRYAEEEETQMVLAYFKAYIGRLSKEDDYDAGELPEDMADIGEFFGIVTNVLFSYDKSAFATLSYQAGMYLLDSFAFDEAKEFFESAKAQGADAGECLLRILFATLQVADEEEFVECDTFSVEMPEYINLLLAIGDNPDMLKKVTDLAEENEQSRFRVAERRKREENERMYQKYNKKGNPALRVLGTVLFWMFSAFSLVYFLFFYENGMVWDLFVHLSPFGREDVTGQIRVSLVTSTIVLCLEVLFYAISFPAMLSERPLAQTTRKHVFLIVVHLLSGFAVWYLMYGYAHWFKNWLGFFNVIASLVLSVILAVLLFGIAAMLSTEWSDTNIDERMETFRGKFWVRGYNRSLLALLYIPFGVFMLNQILSSGTVKLLDSIALLFFFIGGAYLVITSLVYRMRAFVTLANRPELIDYKEKSVMAKTEMVTGVIYIALTIALVIVFVATSTAWSFHIGLDATLLLSGLIHIIFGSLSKEKTKKSADALSDADD